MKALSGTRIFVLGSLILASQTLGQRAPEPRSAQSATTATPQRAFLNQYCIGCHNEKSKTANLMLDKMDVAQVGEHAEVWEKVVRKLRGGMMPPTGARRPDRATARTFTVWLENELDRSATAKPNPGAPSLLRLNRTEYANAIRDLLALEVDVNTMLPADDSSYGFDNIASALGMSPALMERYLSASGKISRLAVGDPSTVSTAKTYAAPVDLTQNEQVEGLPFGTRGGMLIRHHFPVDGEYLLSVALSKSGLQAASVAAGEQLEISIDGDRIKLIDLQPGTAEADAGSSDAIKTQVRTKVTAGMHSLGATFVAKNYAPIEDTLQ